METYTIDDIVEIIRETTKAMLVKREEHPNLWIPFSQILSTPDEAKIDGCIVVKGAWARVAKLV